MWNTIKHELDPRKYKPPPYYKPTRRKCAECDRTTLPRHSNRRASMEATVHRLLQTHEVSVDIRLQVIIQKGLFAATTDGKMGANSTGVRRWRKFCKEQMLAPLAWVLSLFRACGIPDPASGLGSPDWVTL